MVGGGHWVRGAAHPGNIDFHSRRCDSFSAEVIFFFFNKSNEKTLQVLNWNRHHRCVLFVRRLLCWMPTYLPFCFRLYRFFFFFSFAFNLDSSQTSDASGLHAEVKDDLLFGGFNGTAIACSTLAVWLPVISSWHPSSARFIWLPHASKEYFTLKIFLNFYIPLICNEQYIQCKTLG